jgi:hypothetical protein
MMSCYPIPVLAFLSAASEMALVLVQRAEAPPSGGGALASASAINVPNRILGFSPGEKGRLD